MTHTAMGKMLDSLTAGPYASVWDMNKNVQLAEHVRSIVSGIPHYVADDKIVRIIGKPQVQSGFKAMVEAGIHQLPFDPMLIEFTDPTMHGVAFVRIGTKPIGPTDKKAVEGLKCDLYCYPVRFAPDLTHDPGYGFIVATTDPTDPVVVDWGGKTDNQPYTVYVGRGPGFHAGLKEQMALDVAEAMSIALLMLNTRGIEKVPVSMAKLNKARAKGSKAHGEKVPINDYTVVRIGHVFDRHGTAHAIGGSGRHMPVHWRAGHTRKQRMGPRTVPLEQRPEKLVYIAPILVNFESDDEFIPTPKREVRL